MPRHERLTDLIDAFLLDLAAGRGFSPRTVDSYRRDLADWQGWLVGRPGGVRPLRELTADDVTIYLGHLTRSDRSARTVARRLAALRSFARYLRRHGLPAEWTAGVRGPRLPRPVPAFLTEAEMERLFREPAGEAPDERRERAILELLYATGMRLAELVGLNRDESVDLARRRVRVLGKGHRERIIPFGAPAAGALTAYLESTAGRSVADRGGLPFFLGRAGRRISRRSVQELVRRSLARVADRAGLSPHLLRHTMATHLLARMSRGDAAGTTGTSRDGRAATDIRAVQELLGHVSLASTQVYTHVTVDRLRAALKGAHPRGED